MKFADRLIGKGLSFWIITKLISFNLAWMVVLVVPMAVLVATLMAFGSMSQNNEVAILKSAGVSLYRMIVPPLLGSVLVAYLLIQFNNYVYPNANHAARLLMQDISRKKPTLSIVPGVFSQDVQNYSILTKEIDPKTNELVDLTIYDNSSPTAVNIITAEKGKIYYSKNQRKLIMDLHNGEIHESNITDSKPYKKLYFKRHKIAIESDQFSFQQSSPGGPRGDRELGAQDMLVIVDSLKLIRKRYSKRFENVIDKNLAVDSTFTLQERKAMPSSFRNVALRVENRMKTAQNMVKASINRLNQNKRDMNKYWVEIHKKYSLPFACIVFVLIGASLGTMTRRGGFGVAAGISLIFFVIYWAFLIGGEKLADRGMLSPFLGMWSANIVLGLLGIFFTIKSARERITLHFDFLLKLIPKKLLQINDSDENN